VVYSDRVNEVARRILKRTEFGQLLDKLIKESGKKSYEVANDVGWSTAHLSKARSGKTNLSDDFITDLDHYFARLEIGGDDIGEQLQRLALVSQQNEAIIKTSKPVSDRRLNNYRHALDEPIVKLKIELSVPRDQLSRVKELLLMLEKVSDELLDKLLAILR
jgi:hypothetical protein